MQLRLANTCRSTQTSVQHLKLSRSPGGGWPKDTGATMMMRKEVGARMVEASRRSQTFLIGSSVRQGRRWVWQGGRCRPRGPAAVASNTHGDDEVG